MDGLRPCPWANLGGPHTLRLNTNRGFTSVRCGCGASGPGNFSKETAIEAWNKQVKTDPMPNGKSKLELIAIIEAKQAELDRARGLLHETRNYVTLKSVDDFLTETSTVKDGDK